MISFGLITEGLTDQIVIENILAGYFKNPDLDIRPLAKKICVILKSLLKFRSNFELLG